MKLEEFAQKINEIGTNTGLDLFILAGSREENQSCCLSNLTEKQMAMLLYAIAREFPEVRTAILSVSELIDQFGLPEDNKNEVPDNVIPMFINKNQKPS